MEGASFANAQIKRISAVERPGMSATSTETNATSRKRVEGNKGGAKRKKKNQPPEPLTKIGDYMNWALHYLGAQMSFTKLPMRLDSERVVWAVGVQVITLKGTLELAEIHENHKVGKTNAMKKLLLKMFELDGLDIDRSGWEYFERIVREIRLKVWSTRKKRRRLQNDLSRRFRGKGKAQVQQSPTLGTETTDQQEDLMLPSTGGDHEDSLIHEEPEEEVPSSRAIAQRDLMKLLQARRSELDEDEKAMMRNQNNRRSPVREDLLKLGYKEIHMDGYSFWLDREGNFKYYQEGSCKTLLYIPVIASVQGNLLFLASSGRLQGFVCQRCHVPFMKTTDVYHLQRKKYMYGFPCWRIPQQTKFVCTACFYKLENLGYNPEKMLQSQTPGLARKDISEILKEEVGINRQVTRQSWA